MIVSADGGFAGTSAASWRAGAGAGAGTWLGTIALWAGLGRWSAVGRMLMASETTSAATPITNSEVSALPTSRNGLRPSSTGRISVGANSSTTSSAPTGASWVSAPASPAYTEPAVVPSGSWE